MRIAIGSDRCGFRYKSLIAEHLRDAGHEVVDVGTHEEVPSDSPFFANKAAQLVASGKCEYGVLICATGTGMEIAANKVPGIMCCMGYSVEVARLAREHNDCNMISFGQDHMGYAEVERSLDVFLATPFGGKPHHAKRVEQIIALERGEEIELQPVMNPNWGESTGGTAAER